MTKEKIFLAILLLTSFLVRFYLLGDTPPLLWDEAALGYNTYSILQTGRDEHNQLLPLIFKSFGDYKPGAYIYFSLPFVALFGLNPITTRLVSVLAGSLSPLILYFLIRHFNPKSTSLPLLASLLLAFNPFNIHFSRGAWESNVLTFELLLASLFFLKKRYFSSSIVFALSFYTYQSAKMLVPLIILALLVTQRPKLVHFFRQFVISFCLLSFPLVIGFLFGQDANRLQVMSLFSYPRSTTEVQTIISESGLFDYQLLHNRFIFFGRNFLARYFNHFSPRFLAFDGDWQNPRHSAPYIGVLLYPSLVLLIVGLLSSNFRQPITRLFILWLIFAPLPSSLSRDSVSAVRSLPLSIPLIYFSAVGISRLLKLKYLILISYLVSFVYYSDLYFNHLVKKSPKDLLYGYQQAINYVLQNQSKYNQIVFSQFYGQPYIYYLFYSNYSPQRYQQINSFTSNNLDTGSVAQIGNVLFREPNFAQIQQEPHTLAIFSHDEVLRQNVDTNLLIPLSPVNNYSTFYAYQNP